MVGGGAVFLTPSGTDSLELAMMTLGVGPGDEVIVPSFTFSSTATAVQRQGATVRFADIEPRTLSLDLDHVIDVISDRTKAVVAVHYAGQSADLAQLRAYLKDRSIFLVEDAAHALGGNFRGAPFGSFGVLSCFSFHETKNLSCGEGGALVVNDSSLVESVEKIREKGTDRSKFFRGQVDKYTWVSPGSSFLLSDLSASILSAAVDDWAFTQGRRESAWLFYHDHLAPWARSVNVSLQVPLEDCSNPFHMFYILTDSGEARDQLLAHCRERGVMAVSHYQPLADSSEGRIASFPNIDLCEVSSNISSRIVRLPLFPTITNEELQEVVDVLRSWSGQSPLLVYAS